MSLRYWSGRLVTLHDSAIPAFLLYVLQLTCQWVRVVARKIKCKREKEEEEEEEEEKGKEEQQGRKRETLAYDGSTSKDLESTKQA